MENKPVIILGGGLWGSFLAYRLSLLHPHLHFILYERSSTLGGNHTWTFAESDLPNHAMKWLKPFITKSWKGHDIHFPSLSRSFAGTYHSISSRKFHEVIFETLRPIQIKLNNEMPLDIAASEASFVIDTRNECHFRKKGFRKFFGVEIILEEPHRLTRPVVMDARVEQKESYRCLQYLPWDSHTLMIEDIRYSTDAILNLEEMRGDICRILEDRGWKVKQVIREETNVAPIPMSPPIYREEGKVIGLGGILHDTTGESLPEALRLIDRILVSSFRYGEVRKIVKKFREEREKDRSFFRLLNRRLFETSSPENRFKIFQQFYKLPEAVVQRFSRGELQFWDRPLIIAGSSSIPLVSNLWTPTRIFSKRESLSS